MLVYRLVKSRFARDLTGEGARLFGGRWNEPGTPCIYTAESRALAVLEFTVNVKVDEIPLGLSMVTLRIPDAGIHTIPLSELPDNWKDLPASFAGKNFGSKRLAEKKYLAIALPSVVIPEEKNILLNPLYVNAGKIEITTIKSFGYDERIKR